MRFTHLIAISFALLLVLPVFARASSPITVSKLDNGLTLIVQEDHSASLAAVDIWVRSGSINESDSNNGVSHFIEHLVFKSTEKRGPGQVDMEIESLGSSVEAKTSRDWTHFFTVAESKYLDKVLDVLSDVVQNPQFKPEDIEQERKVILDEIARGQSEIFKNLKDETYRAAFKAHPYRLPVEGTPESIAKVGRQTILDFYNRCYTPANTAVVIVGDVTPKDAEIIVRKAFAGFKRKLSTQEKAASVSEVMGPSSKKLTRSTNRSYLSVAFPAPSVKVRPDVYAMDVLMAYLGTGYQSWLISELKTNQKLIADGESDYLTQADNGLAILMASMEPSKTEIVKEAMLAKIHDLTLHPLADYDLARAKRSLEGAFAYDNETLDGKSTTLGFYATVDSAESAQNYVSSIRGVTAEDVQAAAKKYLDRTKAVVVEIGP